MTGACRSHLVQHIHRIVDVPVVMHPQVPTIQTVQKIVEVPQNQYLDQAVDMLVVMQRQSSMTRKLARTAKIPQVPLIDRNVDVLVMMQRHVPMIRRVHRIMSSAQKQLIGFDPAMLTPYWKVSDSPGADWSEAEFLK